jgi:small subunit ribosomal protein S17
MAEDVSTTDSNDNTESVDRNNRKVREGQVTSDGMDKTAVVTVITRKPHPRYKKSMARTTRLYVHDEENTLKVGDKVRVAETRPLSKLKRWRIVEVLERAK